MTLSAPRSYPARVVSIGDAGFGVRIIGVELEGRRKPEFLAGQHAFLSFAEHEPRAYSIANAPGSALLEFHIRDQGHGASGYAAHELKPGETVIADLPHGDHVWRDPQGPVLMIAGGVGIAPMKSMIDHALARGFSHPLHLYWGVREEAALYLDSHFRKLAARHAQFRYIPVLDPAGPAAAALGDFETLAGMTCHLAGPRGLVESASPLLLQKGLEKDALLRDSFT